MSTESEPQRTTADELGRFRKELIENEIPDEVADVIVLHAAKDTISNSGWSVKA